jgi:pyrrolidone-carboxylate peptidase
MRILIYGFGPYRQFRENVTAKIISGLRSRPGLKKLVFPVRFRQTTFTGALSRHRPDIVLGLGQSSRRRIEIESRAVNRRRSRKSDAPKPIFRSGPKHLRATLELKASRFTNRSKNAGDYVCNYSMYVILREIAQANANTRFGFVHIPYDYDVVKARRLIERFLQQCYRSATSRKPQKPGER